jgi:hypothetical protein
MPQGKNGNLFDFCLHEESFILSKAEEVFDGRPDLQRDLASGLVHQRFHKVKDLLSRMMFILSGYELMHDTEAAVHRELFKKILILASKLVETSHDRVLVNYQISQVCAAYMIDPNEIL